MAAVGCGGGARGPATSNVATASAAPATAAAQPKRWLLHTFHPNVVDANRPTVVAYSASLVGPERVEKTVSLPPAELVRWSPDGHWLALCGSVPGSEAEKDPRRALAIRFEGEQVSDPLDLGECTNVEWAPAGQRLLVQNHQAWRIADFSSHPPHQAPIAAELAVPVDWSPNGRRFLARTAGTRDDVQVVHLIEPTPRAEALEFNGWLPHWCRWSPQDALACAVETSSKPPAYSIGVLYAGPSIDSSLPLDARLQAFNWATPNTLVYQLTSGAVHAVRASGDTKLFELGGKFGPNHQVLSPRGNWLLDTASGHVRLWNLTAFPRSQEVPGLSGPLVDPVWSPNGEHAVVGVQRRPRFPAKSDLWLLEHATQGAVPVRVGNVPEWHTISAWFSPGSEWLLVTTGPEVIPLANAGARPLSIPVRNRAVHVATRVSSPLPFGSGEWAPDDRAFVAVDHEGRRVLLFRPHGADLGDPELLRATEPGTVRLLWAPGPLRQTAWPN